MNLAEYENTLRNFMASDEFAKMNDEEKQKSFVGAKNWFAQQNPDTDPEAINRVTEYTNKEWLRNTGRGRVVPTTFMQENNIIFPNQEEGFDQLPKSEQQQKLDEFKLKIPELAASNPTQREDTEFYLNQSVRQLERRVNGKDVGYVADKGKRVAEGFLSTLAQFVGAPDTADKIQDYFQENPEYDEDFGAQLAQGLGSAGSAIVIMAGLAATTKGLGATAGTAELVGTTGMMGANGILRYNEAYKKAIELGLDENKASEAGVAALPAAVVDTIGDSIIAAKFLPKTASRVFTEGTDAAKRAALKEIISDNSMRGKLVEYSVSALGEGLSEAGGDYIAGYGPYLITNKEEFLPTAQESLDSFLVGAVLGAGINSAMDIPDFVGNKTITTKTDTGAEVGATVGTVTEKFATKTARDLTGVERNIEKAPNPQQIYNLIAEGKYKEAYKLSQEQTAPPTKGEFGIDPDGAETMGTAANPKPTKGRVIDGSQESSKESTSQKSGNNETQEGVLKNSGVVVAPVASTPENNINEQFIAGETFSKNELNEQDPAVHNQNVIGAVNNAIKNNDSVYLVTENGEAEIAGTNETGELVAKDGSLHKPEAILNSKTSGLKIIKPAPAPAAKNNITEVPATPETPEPQSVIEPSFQQNALKEITTNGEIATATHRVASQAWNYVKSKLGNTPRAQGKFQQVMQAVKSDTAEGWRNALRDVMGEEKSNTAQAAMSQADKDLADLQRALGQQPEQRKTLEDVLVEQAPNAVSAVDYLENIKKSFKSAKSIAVINRMIADIKTKNPNLRIMNLKIVGVRGAYYAATNTIYMSNGTLENLAHEVGHALTNADLVTYINNRTEATYKEKLDAAFFDENTPVHIKSLIDVYYASAKALGFYEQIGNIITAENISEAPKVKTGAYGFTSIEEFVAESYGSQAFQEKLASVIYNGKTIWEQLVEIIQKALPWIKSLGGENVLRSDGENALVTTLAAINQIINSGETQTGNNINFLPGADFRTGKELENLGKEGAFKSLTVAKDGTVPWQNLRAKIEKGFSVQEVGMVIPMMESLVVDGRININDARDAAKELAASSVTVARLNATKTQEDTVARRSEIEHELDTYWPEWFSNSYGEGGMYTPQGFKTVSAKWASLPEEAHRLYEEYYNLTSEPVSDTESEAASSRYTFVNPKPLEDMPDARDITVEEPLKHDDKLFNEQVATGMLDYEEYNRRITKFEEGTHFPTRKNVIGFGRMYDETLPSGEPATFIFEVQSDWAAKQSRLLDDKININKLPDGYEIVKEKEKRYNLKDDTGRHLAYGHTPELAVFNYNRAIENVAKEKSTPLLSVYEHLVLKAAIHDALNKGQNHIAITDAETAMMTEQHDLHATSEGYIKAYKDYNEAYVAAQNLSDKYNDISFNAVGNLVSTFSKNKDDILKSEGFEFKPRKIEQEPGMRAAYDPKNGRLHNIMRKLTGSKGMPVDFGIHQNAISDIRDPNEPNNQADNILGRNPFDEKKTLKGSPIFKNPDGTPKSNITAIAYPLDKVNQDEISLLFPSGKNNINFLPEDIEAFNNYAVNKTGGINFLPSDKVKKLGVTGTAEKFIYQYENKVEWNSVFNKKTLEDKLAEFKKQAIEIVKDRTSDASIEKKAESNLRKYLESLASRTNLVGQARESAELFKQDPEGHSKRISEDLYKRRIEGMNEWRNYLLEINDVYSNDPFFVAYVWNGITSNISKTNTEGTPALDANALGYVYEDANNDYGLRDFNDVYEKAAERASLESVSKENSVTLPNGTTWIKIPRTREGEQDYEKNLATLRNLSLQSWCTSGPQMSATYIQRGNFWMLSDEGRIRMAIRFDGEEVAEIQGPANNGSIPNEYLDHVIALKESGKISLSRRAEESLQKSIARQAEVEELKALDPYDAIRRIGLIASKDDDGNITLSGDFSSNYSSNNRTVLDNTFIDYSKVNIIDGSLSSDLLEYFKNVSIVTEKFIAKKPGVYSSIKKVGKISVGIEVDGIVELPGLEEISSNDFFDKQLRTPNLKKIIGNLGFDEGMENQFQSIEEIIGNVSIYSSATNMVFENVKHIRGELFVASSNPEFVNFPNLESLDASWERPSYLNGTFPKLKSVTGPVGLFDISAPELEYVESLATVTRKANTPKLKKVESFKGLIFASTSIEEIYQDMEFSETNAYINNDIPLKTIGGNLIISGGGYMTFNGLEKIEGSFINNDRGSHLLFRNLKSIGGNIESKPENVDEFWALESVGGKVINSSTITKSLTGYKNKYNDNKSVKVAGKEIPTSNNNNINFLPISPEEDQEYLDQIDNGATDEELQIKVDDAFRRAGFDATNSYFRGDEVEWTEANRPIYLTLDNDLAQEFTLPEFKPRRFYIKRGLRLAKPGDIVNGKVLRSSSFINKNGRQIPWGNFKLATGITVDGLRKAGYDGIEGGMDGSGKHEIVIIDPSNVKLADPVTFDLENQPIPLSKRADTSKNNINYLPEQQVGQKRLNQFKRLAAIRKGNLSDKFDNRTQTLIKLMADIKNSDISNLPDGLQDYFFSLVDNIYNSRKIGVTQPDARFDSDVVISELQQIKSALDSQAIAKMIGDFDELIDFDSLGIDLKDREAVEKAINEYTKANSIEDTLAKQIRSEKSKARLEKVYANWRKKYNEIREVIIQRYADADNYIAETEAMEGAKIISQEVRDFLREHYNYITGLDVSEMEGIKLYNHFFALNNISDGSFNGMRTTVQYMAASRDQNEKIHELINKFRDPVVNKNKFLRMLDKYNQAAELHQVQLGRLSAYKSITDWLQNKFMGKLYDAIIRTSKNRKDEYIAEYATARDDFENQIGRKMNEEDRILISIFGRLSQSELGSDPDKALMTSITKERKSINNIISTHGDSDLRRVYKNRVLPMFEAAVEGLEGQGSMLELMNSFEQRIAGEDSLEVGQARKQLLEKVQEIFSRFNLESKIISEGLHNTPFKQQQFYIPNDVMSIEAQGEEVEMDTPISDQNIHTAEPGIASKANHFKGRMGGLGDGGYYSYNIEHTIGRNIERLSVDTATIVERCIIKERLKKGSALNNIISKDEEGNSHPERVNMLKSSVIKLYSNAVSRGEPLNYGVQLLRLATSVYSKPVLSSVHHIITQPLGALIDYGTRNQNYSGWLSAAAYYAANFDKVNAWFARNQKWTSDRIATEALAIDQRRSPIEETSEDILNNPIVKFLNGIYDNAGKVMNFAIHQGDNFSVKATILAEYERLLKQKGMPIDNIYDIDLGTIEGEILSNATLNAELSINTSNKILRGDLFTDRKNSTTVIRNLLFAFSAHQGSLATQMNMAIRDLHELKAVNAPRSEMDSKIRTISAIIGQQVAFTTMRFAIGAGMASLMLGAARSAFDDEDGKIAELYEKLQIARKKGDPVKVAVAEQEYNEARNIRKLVVKMEKSTQSSDSLFKQMIRDGTGSFSLIMNNGAAQKILFLTIDPWMEAIQRAGQEDVVNSYTARIKEAEKKNNFKLAARLNEEKTIIEGAEYIPFAFAKNGGMGMDGIYGAMIDSYGRVATKTNKALMGTTEYSWNDLAISAASMGIGQSELTKTMNAFDKIEDSLWKSRKSFNETRLPAAEERKDKKKTTITSRLY